MVPVGACLALRGALFCHRTPFLSLLPSHSDALHPVPSAYACGRGSLLAPTIRARYLQQPCTSSFIYAMQHPRALPLQQSRTHASRASIPLRLISEFYSLQIVFRSPPSRVRAGCQRCGSTVMEARLLRSQQGCVCVCVWRLPLVPACCLPQRPSRQTCFNLLIHVYRADQLGDSTACKYALKRFWHGRRSS